MHKPFSGGPDASQSAARGKAWPFRLVLLIISATLWFACTEAALRLFPGVMPWAVRSPYLRSATMAQWDTDALKNIDGIWVDDKDLGLKRPPLMTLDLPEDFIGDAALSRGTDPRKEKTQTRAMVFDRNSFRNDDDPAIADIVALGDSYTEGLYIDRPWPRRLGDITGRKVYNLGRARFGSTFERVSYLKYGIQKSPRLVILAFFEGNDLDDVGVYDRWKRMGIGMLEDKKMALTRKSEKDKKDREEKGYLDRLLVPKVVVYYLSRLTGARRTLDEDTPTPGRTGWFPFSNNEGRFEMAFMRPYIVELMSNRTRLAGRTELGVEKDDLKAISDTCTRNNTRFMIVYIPCKEHIYLPMVQDTMGKEPFDREMALYTRTTKNRTSYASGLAENADNLNKEIGEFCRAQGINFLDLTPVFKERAYKDVPLYFLGDSHFNQHGADLAAEAIAGYMARKDMLGAK